MTQKKTRQKRLVKEIEFKMQDNQSLIINYCLLPSAGLDRVIVQNKNGVVHVCAQGRSRFEFSDISKTKDNPNQTDFILSNAREQFMIEDIIRSKFWRQFTWGELLKYDEDRKFNKILNQKIKELVKEFEAKAAEQLNQLLKQHKNDPWGPFLNS